MKTRTSFAAVALAIAFCAPAHGAEQTQDSSAAGHVAPTAADSEELIWGDALEVFAALRRTVPEQVDARFEEGGYVDQGVPLYPFPKTVLPSLNPFSELDLHVVLSNRDAAVVLPRTRRILKVYQAPSAMGETIAPARGVEPTVSDVRADKAEKRGATHQAASQRAPRQARQKSQEPTPPRPAAPEPDRRAVISLPEVSAETAPKPANSDAPEARVLLERADARRKTGDILAARQFLELAARRGSVEALTRLAETYDPKVLATWGARGVRPDEAKAAKLYAEAEDRESRANLSARAEHRRE